MTHSELKELVKAHFSLVDAPSKFAEETPRTAAEEEGYKDGMEDAIEDIKEAISEVEKQDMAEEMPVEDVNAVEEEAEEAKEEMEEVEVELEPAVSMEDVVKAISEIVGEEMKKMEEKYNALAAKFETVAMEPAAEKTIPVQSDSKVEKFNVATAANSKTMEMALKMIKNKK